MESSTPSSSQNLLLDSQEFGALSGIGGNSQPVNAIEPEPAMQKISNIEAWNILHEVNTQAQASEKCVEKLSGSKIQDLTGEDLELCGHLI